MRRTEVGPLSVRALSALAASGVVSVGYGQANLLPLDPGETVVTCHSGYLYNENDPTGWVVAIIDTRDPAGNGAILDTNWAPPMYHGEANVGNEWNVRNLGQVFGVCLDTENPPNIYVTASTVYGSFINGAGLDVTFGPGGGGGVYKIDGTTGAISTFISLPNTGPGLGNIAYDELHDQFYVSNFEDGLVYVIDNLGTSGAITTTFDHGVDGLSSNSLPTIDDSMTDGWTALGRRVWGVENFQGRLYYGVWNEDPGCHPSHPAFALHAAGRGCPTDFSGDNEIWSVGINPGTGLPDLSDIQLEISIPPLNASGTSAHSQVTSSPVSDIAFTSGGKLLAAERTRLDDPGRGRYGVYPTSPWDAHGSRVLEATGSAGSWALSPLNTYRIGWAYTSPPTQLSANSAGGVAALCDESAWCTGDSLHFNFPSSQGRYVYGIQWVDAGGNAGASPTATTDSYVIDFDGFASGAGNVHKTQVGDVEVYEPGCSCMDAVVDSVDCSMEPGGPLDLTLTITNNSGKPGDVVYLIPTSPSGMQIDDAVINLTTTLLDGDSATLNASVTLPAGFDGDKITFFVVLLTADLEECCAVELCVDIPDCDCLLVNDWSFVCDPDDPTKYIYTANITNLALNDVYRLVFQFPNGESAVPPIWDLSTTPLASGDSVDITITICDAVPGSELCMLIGAHDDRFIECCSIKETITVPICDPTDPVPDNCIVTRVANCCPPQFLATVTITICNNGSTPETYSWNATPFSAPPCLGMLDPSSFLPGSGSLGPVAPGTCESTTIQIRCDQLAPGTPAECAGFLVTFLDSSGNGLECDGIVQVKDEWKVEQIEDPVDIPRGEVREVQFRVTNLADPSGVLDYRFEDLAPDGEFDYFAMSMDGLLPGAPSTGRVQGLEVGMSEIISTTVSFNEAGVEGLIEQLYVTTDLDFDGVRETAAGTHVRSVMAGATTTCDADFNRDEVVNVLDLLEFLMLWFDGSLASDFDGNGLVNVIDLLGFLDAWFQGCPE